MDLRDMSDEITMIAVHGPKAKETLQRIMEEDVSEVGPFVLDLEAVAGVWNRGTVILSWMLELAGRALRRDPGLWGLRGGGETGRWMVETALELGVPTPTIDLSLLMRYRSRQEDIFAEKVVAAIRR